MTSRFASLVLASVVSLTLFACGGDKPAEQPKASQSQPTQPAPATIEPAPAPEPTATQQAPTEQTPTEQAPQVALSADAGQKRYEATCKVCHDSGMLDAPKLGDKAAWQPRIAKGIETLYHNSAKGFNKMPAQAVGDVSEAEVKAAVDYIISKSS